jgi:hypothetical protein
LCHGVDASFVVLLFSGRFFDDPYLTKVAEQSSKFIDLDLGIADEVPEQAWLERFVVGNGKRLSRWIGGMSQANMAAPLARYLVTRELKCPYRVLTGEER